MEIHQNFIVVVNVVGDAAVFFDVRFLALIFMRFYRKIRRKVL